MSTKKIICLILTFLPLLVCVASCQAANAGITTQEQAADRQSSDAPAETVSYGKDSSDRTEAEASHTKNVTEDVLPSEPDPASEGETMIYAHIGDKTLTIRPEDNSSAKAFVELLQGGDRTILRCLVNVPAGRSHSPPYISSKPFGLKSLYALSVFVPDTP